MGKIHFMLLFFRPLLLLFSFSLLYSSVAFSQSDFNKGYEAAQSGNYKRAISLWTPLAEDGDALAQYTLGWMFESGQGVKKSEQQALIWYTKAANQGHMAAQNVLATMYSKGTGVAQDNKKAVSWFIKAANQGDAIAQFQLGVHFQKGLGVEQDHKESLKWFKKSAAQGHITSQINLGKIYQFNKEATPDYKEAIKWYEKAASQGNALGQYYLAHMYEYGRGVNQDFKKSKSLYLQSANNHYSPSAYKIAEFYELGKGSDIDYKNALKWYKKAAFKSHSGSQVKLGELYKEGKGVKKDIRSAITWYTLAANQDNAQAHYQLAVIYEKGVKNEQQEQIIKINSSNAFQHFLKASQLGAPLAHARLAYLYEKGIGTETNLKKAKSLYQKSTQPWAMARYQQLSKLLDCYETATTKLFAVNIACTTRKILREKIKEQGIVAIDESDNDWSDTYFTGAVVRGTSELQVTYTRDDYFVGAKYTFIGRDKPQLISNIKDKLAIKYGEPDKKMGIEDEGEASFEWLMDDGILLKVYRAWPDTTTFVHYVLVENQLLLDTQQAQSSDKTFVAPEKEDNVILDPNIF